jgi:hypothetical protein
MTAGVPCNPPYSTTGHPIQALWPIASAVNVATQYPCTTTQFATVMYHERHAQSEDGSSICDQGVDG